MYSSFSSKLFIIAQVMGLGLTAGILIPVTVQAEPLDTSDDSPSFQQIARMMQNQNPRQADRETNQCFLEIMDVKEDVLNQPFPLPKEAKIHLKPSAIRPVSTTRESYR